MEQNLANFIKYCLGYVKLTRERTVAAQQKYSVELPKEHFGLIGLLNGDTDGSVGELINLDTFYSYDPKEVPKTKKEQYEKEKELANKNQVLASGPITDTRYGGPTNMASVGGWTVTTGSVMDYYDKHALATLTSDQQALVEKIAKGIYRPCCNNSTYFPDCNHGMAMLGLLEYLASQGATEDQMWNAAITANMSWFPDQYQTIAQYLKTKGIDAKTITPQMLLGAEYSSGSGFARIAAQVPQTQQQRGGSGCGVDAGGASAAPQRQQGGCGI